jgi:DNA-binding NarL/FixJ family response regulator
MTADLNTRVLIAADTLLARVGLAAMLQTTEHALDVVGQTPAGDGESLLDDLDVYRPDVVAIDLGYEPLAMLPHLLLLAETAMPFVALLPDATHAATIASSLVEAPAYGLLSRDGDAGMLAAALAATGDGLITLDPALAGALFPAGMGGPLEQPNDPLTPRESDVLQLLAQGLTNKAIAQSLDISPNTVKFHINAILSKLDAQSRTEAVVRATRLGLVVL